MRVSDATVQQMLLDAGKIKQGDIAKISKQVADEKRPMQDIVLKDNLINEKDSTLQ